MTAWTARIIAVTGTLTTDQTETIAAGLPPGATAQQLGDTDRTILSFEIADADNLVEATSDAYALARAVLKSTLGTADLVGARIDTTADYWEELMHPQEPDLIGISEVAEMLGVSRQRAEKMASGGQNSRFPKALRSEGRAKLYHRVAVERFVNSWTPGKPGRPKRADA
ncbi:hypothetical protein EDD29_0088 [Actinocorallia herbida]|uniref:Helix-turn-helix protein n=1 Tax=Actinocorallia herbida TaxID=58109 RepID=A0A3N1CMR5_9ACTN|nr:helix-turn-helix domain-containing protein [Actinocorallia herbida]ROO82607.1 hypothetical protein EDD29_0088 [Actinocorallia herbida]